MADVDTAKESVDELTGDTRTIVALIDFATLLVLAIAAAGLLVATIDSVLERRRPLAVLAAVGTPVSLLRRAVLLQSAIPLACGLAVAAGAALHSTLVVAANDAALALPLRARRSPRSWPSPYSRSQASRCPRSRAPCDPRAAH